MNLIILELWVMAKWTNEETKILEQTIEENEGIDFNDFVDLLATKIDRTKKSIIAKTNNDDKTKRLMRDYRIIRKKINRTANAVVASEIIKKFKRGNSYELSNYGNIKNMGLDNWTRRAKLIRKTDRFGVFDLGSRKECFLWTCYGLDWKVKGIR